MFIAHVHRVIDLVDCVVLPIDGVLTVLDLLPLHLVCNRKDMQEGGFGQPGAGSRSLLASQDV